MHKFLVLEGKCLFVYVLRHQIRGGELVAPHKLPPPPDFESKKMLIFHVHTSGFLHMFSVHPQRGPHARLLVLQLHIDLLQLVLHRHLENDEVRRRRFTSGVRCQLSSAGSSSGLKSGSVTERREIITMIRRT